MGVKLAASLPVPDMKWHAFGDVPLLRLENTEEFACFRHLDISSQLPKTWGDDVYSGENLDSHLDSSEDNEMLILREASAMVVAGFAIIIDSLGMTDDELEKVGSLSRLNQTMNPVAMQAEILRVTVEFAHKSPSEKGDALEAGIQLICDAYIADGLSVTLLRQTPSFMAIMGMAHEALPRHQGTKLPNGEVQIEYHTKTTMDLFQYIIFSGGGVSHPLAQQVLPSHHARRRQS